MLGGSSARVDACFIRGLARDGVVSGVPAAAMAQEGEKGSCEGGWLICKYFVGFLHTFGFVGRDWCVR